MAEEHTYLFIIEAPGKRKALSATLEKLGISGQVFSTNGHILQNDKSLWPIGITKNFIETNRRPIRPELCEELIALSSHFSRVIIATDPDDEGHVIASDIARLLTHHQAVYRALCYGFDELSMRKALSSLTYIDHGKATPGNVRRVIDRWIGSTFSSKEKGIGVGRIITGALALANKIPVTLGYLPIEIASSDGGGAFRANIPLNRDNLQDVDLMVEEVASIGALDVDRKEVETASRPYDHVDMVLALSKKTGESIKVIEERLQRFYEGQHISYPRTDCHSFNRHTVKMAEELAHHNHIKIRSDFYPINDDEHAHESIHILDTRYNVNEEIAEGTDKEILQFIGREFLRAAQASIAVYPDLRGAPQWVKEQIWKRQFAMQNGWHDKADPPAGQPVMLTKEQAALQFLHEQGLGRPGTMVSHAVRLTSKPLLTDEFELTQLGREYLSIAPTPLFNGDVHQLLERIGNVDLPMDVTEQMRIFYALERSGLLASSGLDEQAIRIIKDSLEDYKDGTLDNHPEMPKVNTNPDMT